jgi:hypothetical protein
LILGGYEVCPLVKELVKLQVELSKQPWEHCLMRAALYSNRGRMPLALVRAEKTL